MLKRGETDEQARPADETADPSEEQHNSVKAKRLSIEWTAFKKGRDSEEAVIKRALRQTPLFEQLSGRDWKLVSDLFHLRRYERGEIIFEMGTPGLGMYVIVEGEVGIVAEENDEEIYLNTLYPGDFFGEMSLVDEVERTASAVAETPTILVGLFRPQLQDLMRHRPSLGIVIYERIARIVVQRLRQTNIMLSKKIRELSREHERLQREQEGAEEPAETSDGGGEEPS
jgi:CRP-like cAMP-binding protein